MTLTNAALRRLIDGLAELYAPAAVGVGSVKANFDPEYVNAFEVGMKNTFLEGRLTANLTAFYYDYSNQQVQDTRAGPVSFLVNAPKSEIYGAELETTFKVWPTLTLNGSLGLLHAQYDTLTLQNTDLSGNPA